jgi:chitodextrinase
MRASNQPRRLLRAVFFAFVAVMSGYAAGEAQIDPSRSIVLRWTAPGDDEDVGQVTSYQVRYHTTIPGGSSIQSWWDAVPTSQRVAWGHGLASAGNVDSVRVSNLSPSTTYYFVIRALDDAGNISDFSNVAQGTTAPACVAPASAPQSFAAAADTGEVVVTWAPTTDPEAVSLHLYRSVGTTGAWTRIQSLALGTTKHVDTSVQPGAIYRYRAAWMGSACEGPYTAPLTLRVPGGTSNPSPQSQAVADPSIRVYPNPSTGPVTLEIQVPGTSSEHVHVRLYDMKGRLIATLADGVYPPGLSRVSWSRVSRTGTTVGAGYYELVGKSGDTKVRDRLVVLP